jgi:hypothetical protein
MLWESGSSNFGAMCALLIGRQPPVFAWLPSARSKTPSGYHHQYNKFDFERYRLMSSLSDNGSSLGIFLATDTI